MQHGEGVAGAMAHRQGHLIGDHALAIRQDQSLHSPGGAVELEALHLGPEAHLTAHGLDPAAEAAHHRGELEGADMGPVQGEDLGMGAGGHQFFENLADERFRLTHLAIKLAIRKGAGPPLTELDIGLRIEGALAPPEAKGIGRAFLHGLSPLQQEWPQTHLGQQEGHKIATGACPHHHGTGTRLGDIHPGQESIMVVRNGTQVGVPLEAAQQTPLTGRVEI